MDCVMKNMNVSKKAVKLFQEKIFLFYKEHGRDLPWRHTVDPYCILLSEIMLQQTQVSRVISYYTRWTRQWPTIEDLDSELLAIAEQCLPKGRSREWHNALMDYGALKMTAAKTGVKSKTQQSRFEGSDRQIRAKILRQLLKDSFSFDEIQQDLHVEKERLKKILEKMSVEGVIGYKEERYHVPLF